MYILELVQGFFLTRELQVLIFVLLFFPGSALMILLVARLKLGPFPQIINREEGATIKVATQRNAWRGRIPVAAFLFLISLAFFIPAWRETRIRFHSFQTIATVTGLELVPSASRLTSVLSAFNDYKRVIIDYSYSVNGSFYVGKASLCYKTQYRNRDRSANSGCETYQPRRGDTYPIFVSRADPTVSHLPKPFVSNWFFGLLFIGLASFFFFERSASVSKGSEMQRR